MKKQLIGLALVLALFSLALALPLFNMKPTSDLEDGFAAYDQENYELAFTKFKKLADSGDAEGQYNLGEMYLNGKGTKENEVEAERLYKLAANQGLAQAQYNLGKYYEESNLAEATRWLKKAAEQGHAPAQISLGFLMGGEDLKDAEALQWMEKAATQDYDEAYMFLYFHSLDNLRDEENKLRSDYYLDLCCFPSRSPGMRFNNVGNRTGVTSPPISPFKDDAKMRWYVKEAEQGNVVAQYKLGIIYGGWVFGDNIHSNKYYGDTGNGINRSEGRRLLRIAAEQGNVFASYELRNLAEVDFITTSFDNIEDETQASAAVAHWDELAAGQWYGIEKKAERGDAEEQYNLGEMHFHGKGTEPNSIKAFRWYELAANQGFAPAQNMIGLMYTKNEDIVQNYAEAVRWYKLAADQGYANAQHNLGVMYQKGSGVTQSYAEAEKWYKLAAAQGYAPAQDVLKELGW